MPQTRTIITGLLLALAFALLVGGCVSGGGNKPTVTTGSVPPATEAPTTGSTAPVVLDELSTFKSKDPFKQQALPPASTSTTGTGGSSTTTTTGSGSTTTTTGGGSTTTSAPSGVNTALHSLKVLAIDVINGTPVVTFEVDDTVYEDKKEGDVVNTSWGQIEVVDINAADQVVVFLHGSETRTLGVGQEFLK
ncbi:MAG: hypothetical protein M1325_06250 [Actinobacteria bacterium]|nr:hypothetical protein [Actinomycetota bacterium]